MKELPLFLRYITNVEKGLGLVFTKRTLKEEIKPQPSEKGVGKT